MAKDQTTEEFRPVAEFPRWRVSNLGRVQKKKTPGRRAVDPNNFVWVDCPLRPAGDGYRQVKFWDGSREYRKYVHRLVLEAFVGPYPPGMQVRHFPDPDRSNNRLENLSWGTPAENMADKHAQGSYQRGTKRGTKLTEAGILEMRAMRRRGVPRKVIAERFGITPEWVSKMILGYGRYWKHIAPDPSQRAALKQVGFSRGGRAG